MPRCSIVCPEDPAEADQSETIHGRSRSVEHITPEHLRCFLGFCAYLLCIVAPRRASARGIYRKHFGATRCTCVHMHCRSTPGWGVALFSRGHYGSMRILPHSPSPADPLALTPAIHDCATYGGDEVLKQASEHTPDREILVSANMPSTSIFALGNNIACMREDVPCSQGVHNIVPQHFSCLTDMHPARTHA
jgi:hypothetical protein